MEHCEECKRLIDLGRHYCDGEAKNVRLEMEALDMLIAHSRSRRCMRNKKSPVHVGNGTPSGAFAFTLTKSPRDPYTVGDMLTAVRKICTQKSCPVKRYAWYYEDKGRDENGDPIHPHIHGMYETESGGRIETKHFKRAWPLWDPEKLQGMGFKGGYHGAVKSDEAYSDYIKKDGGMSESFNADE